MNVSALAALSTVMTGNKTQSDLSMAAAKNAIDSQRAVGAALVSLLSPDVGTRLNVSA